MVECLRTHSRKVWGTQPIVVDIGLISPRHGIRIPKESFVKYRIWPKPAIHQTSMNARFRCKAGAASASLLTLDNRACKYLSIRKGRGVLALGVYCAIWTWTRQLFNSSTALCYMGLAHTQHLNLT